MTSEKTSGKQQRSAAVDMVRVRAAQIVRLVLTVFAGVLAVGALLVAMRHSVNSDNSLVHMITSIADAIDGPFGRTGGIFDFDGPNAVTKNALVNWGIAALVYLGIGRFLERILKP